METRVMLKYNNYSDIAPKWLRLCKSDGTAFLRLENAGSTALSAPTSVFEDGQQNKSLGVEAWMSAEDSSEPPRRAVRKSIQKMSTKKLLRKRVQL